MVLGLPGLLVQVGHLGVVGLGGLQVPRWVVGIRGVVLDVAAGRFARRHRVVRGDVVGLVGPGLVGGRGLGQTGQLLLGLRLGQFEELVVGLDDVGAGVLGVLDRQPVFHLR